MPRGKCPFTDTQVDRAIELVHKHGYVVTALRKHADGFTIMTSRPDMTRKPGEGRVNEWDEIFSGQDQSETR